MLRVWAARRGYVSIIKKYPQGLGDRMERFDQWTRTWNDPNFNTYYDFFRNAETLQHDALIPDTESSKTELAQCAARYRPVIAEFTDKLKINENPFVDDHLLSTEVSHLSLRQFLREAASKQTRSDLHRFFLWGCACFVLVWISFYQHVLKQDYKQQIVQLEPDESYYRYNPNILEYEVNAFIQKINFLNNHSNDELIKAKERAEKRRKSKPQPSKKKK